MNGALSIALRTDPDVPQRDALMDLDRVVPRLSAGLGANGPIEIESCRRTCVSYRVGRRMRVVYKIGIDGTEHYVAASSFRGPSRSERAYRQAMESGESIGPLRAALHDDELNTVFWTFPNDRWIKSLAEVADGPPRLTPGLDRRWARSRLVDYYPEVSAVVQCLDDSNGVVAYAKVHAGNEGERTHRAQQAFVRAARDSMLRLARPLVYSKQLRTLVVEPIAGLRIGELAGPDVLSGLQAYGAALGTLHSLRPDDVPPPPRQALDRLQRKATGIGVVRPDVKALSAELLESLESRWEGAAGEPVLVHGDTNVNNAIFQDGRVAFIDFDRASTGPASSDIGNLLAMLRYFRSLGILTPGAARERASAFVEGYSSVRDLPDLKSLRVHISAALAERGFRAVNRVRPRSLVRVPALLAEAKALLTLNGDLW